MKKAANFNFLDHYTYFVPNVPDLMILFLWFVVGSVLGNVISFIFMTVLGQETGMELGLVVAYPAMFIPPMIYASSRSRRNCLNHRGLKLDSSNFGVLGPGLCVLFVIVGTLCASYIADAVGALLPQMPERLKEIMESMVSGNLLLNLLCVSIFAPVFEEWLCRGMVLRGLLGNNVKPVWAIIISALFFALIHLNPWQAVPAFLLGCLFGYVYYKTGSLKLTMLMHFTNNTFALFMSRIPALEDMENWKDVLSGPAYYLVFACCVLIVALIVLEFSKIENRSRQGNLDVVPSLFEQ